MISGGWRGFHGRVKEALIARHASGLRLLDVGCGVGGDVWRWRRAGVRSVVGIEPDLASVVEASRRISTAGGGDRFFVMHSPDTPEKLSTFARGAFECASAMFSMHLMEGGDRLKVLNELVRVVGSGGAVFVCVPDGDALVSASSEVVSVHGGRAWWNLDAPYFKRTCAPESEPVLSVQTLMEEMTEVGLHGVHAVPFSSMAGFESLSECDKRVSELYSAVIAFV
jgi:ubiquinone/menaquinone biosynthesis C-methylase UbiE